MKRLILLLTLITIGMSTLVAQKIAILPKVGINIATMKNQEMAISSGYTQFESSKTAVRTVVAADFIYSLNDRVALISGLSYNQRGCSFCDVVDKTGNILKNNYKLDYLDLPIKLRVNLVGGLGVSSGLVFGFLIKARHNQDDLRIICNNINYSLPLGISYEWKHLVLDVTYEFGLNHVYCDGDVNHRNCLVTLGYKFKLK